MRHVLFVHPQRRPLPDRPGVLRALRPAGPARRIRRGRCEQERRRDPRLRRRDPQRLRRRPRPLVRPSATACASRTAPCSH